MLIAQITDTHILDRAADHPSQKNREDWLRQCVADINRQRPDAVIFTGDTVQHGQPDEYAILRELLSPLEPPLYIVPGNRDSATNLRVAFGDKPYLSDAGDFVQYVVNDHDLQLVALDSTLAGERKGVFCEQRQAWLDQVLDRSSDQPTCLFIHHPPFDVGEHYIGGYRESADATGFAEVVSRHPQVQALICGHVHWPVEQSWAGTQARIMPSVAVDLRKGIDEEEAQGRPVYMLHRWTEADGLVSTAQLASD
ncbi:MAG: phosphodiesterase [Woeseiaceae bacterium]